MLVMTTFTGILLSNQGCRFKIEAGLSYDSQPEIILKAEFLSCPEKVYRKSQISSYESIQSHLVVA